jgi:hypothetical protein
MLCNASLDAVFALKNGLEGKERSLKDNEGMAL